MAHVQTQLILLLTYDKKTEKTGISDEVPVFSIYYSRTTIHKASTYPHFVRTSSNGADVNHKSVFYI